MRGTLARQRRRDTAAAVDDRSWLPSPADVLDALHLQEAHDVDQPPALRATPAPRSWAIHVTAEEWAKIPAWWSGAHWFDTLLDWMQSADRARARDRWHVADATLLAIAHVLRYAAEPSTGRHVTLAYATIRQRVEANTEHADGRTIRLRADETVRLCLRTLEAGGFVHVHATGRNLLSREEKAEAFETHGGRQEQAANVLALTLPPLPPVENSTSAYPVLGLTASNTPKQSSSVELEQQSPREMERATRAQPEIKRVHSDDHSTYVPERGRSLDRQRLLAHLDRHYGGALAGPRLGKSGKLLRRHIGQIEHALTAAGVDLDRWTWWQIAQLVDARHSTEKTTAQRRVTEAADPLSYFIWMVKQVIQPGELPRAIIATRPADDFTNTALRRTMDSSSPQHVDELSSSDVETHQDADIDRYRERTRARLIADTERKRITETLLGRGAHPAEFPQVVRALHAEVQALNQRLAGRGWELDHHELEHGEIAWINPSDRVDVDVQADLNTHTSIRFTPPATADDRRTYILNKAGGAHTDRLCTLSELLRATNLL